MGWVQEQIESQETFCLSQLLPMAVTVLRGHASSKRGIDCCRGLLRTLKNFNASVEIAPWS